MTDPTTEMLRMHYFLAWLHRYGWFPGKPWPKAAAVDERGR